MHKKTIRKLAQLHGWWVARTFLARTSAFSEEQRQEWITEALRETLVRAADGTRYYGEVFRAAGFDPRVDFKSPLDLRALPVLTKDIVRERFEDLVDRRFARFAALAETSGTTGQPMRMLLNERYIALDYACMYRMWAQAGYRFRDPFVALRSYVPSRAGDPLWKLDRAQNTLFMSAYHFSPQNAAEYLRRIEEFGPRFIRGYPSSLVVLAEHLRRAGRQLGYVRGLFTASETLTERERGVIEEVFGKILFDWYGMTEPTLVAFEGAEHDGLNIVWQYGHAEFLPGENLASESFRLVATSLHNPVMPFIRYETGDVVTPSHEDAQAVFPKRLLAVQGRKDDLVITPDGRRLPSVNFYSVFRDARAVSRFQIVQYGSSDVVVNIETARRDWESTDECRRLKADMHSRLGDGVAVEYRANQRFETNRDGKMPVVLRRLGNKSVEDRAAYALSSQAAWERARAGEDVLKLDWNESDTLPSPRVRTRLAKLIEDERAILWYPEARPRELMARLSRYARVPEDHLLLAQGSDSALDAVCQCYLSAGDKALIITPAYDHFRAMIEQRGASVVTFPHVEGSFPVGALCDAVRAGLPRIICLSNPNNPVGYLVPREDVESVCRAAEAVSAIVVLDEAYAEFAKVSAADLTLRHANLIVCRTFSKAFGLAGLRIGYVIASSAIIGTLSRVVNPKNVSTLAQAAAEEALGDLPALAAHVDEVISSREMLLAALEARGIACYPSHANFVLLRCDDAPGMVRWLQGRGVFVRDRSAQFGGAGHVRVTIGGQVSIARLLEALDVWLESVVQRESVGVAR